MIKSFNRQRKIVSLLLAFTMILTALPLAGVTAFANTSGDFKYNILEDGTAEITKYNGNADVLDIPSKLDTYTVTSIGFGVFWGCDSLTSVTIPDGVISIGETAFYSCEGLTSVTIPDSVTSIGDWAFGECSNLTEIKVDTNNKNYTSQDGVLFNKDKTELIQYPTGNERTSYNIPKGVTSIGYRAFGSCDSLTSVTIPDSVTSIDYFAFSGCNSLTSVTIPGSVTSMGDDAFSYCDNLASVTIGNGVTSICDDAFAFCNSLTSVTIPISVTSIGNGAFFECYSLTSVKIPESVTSIGEGTFAYCHSLTNVTIPESVTSIGREAFAYCNSLTSVTIPESVTSIGESAFEGCDSLTEIKVDTNNKNYSSQDGVLFNKNKTELIQYPIGNKRTLYDIPKGVTSIGCVAFVFCKLTSITIPESVTSMGDYAFGWCDLISVTIPDSVTKIGNYAFAGCSSLTDIYILNKECNIEEDNEDPDALTIPTETTIHGYAGSTAKEYAKVHGNKFMAINAIGDIDGNANITITDAKWILQNTVKSRNLTEAQAKAADLNKDGKITIVDAKWVLQIVVGLRDAQTLKPIKK